MDVFLDFETRSRCDLKRAGAYRYAADPSTAVLCLAFAVGDGDILSWQPGRPLPTELVTALRSTDTTWHAHNANFERVIWPLFARQFGLPDIPLRQWECTAARAAAAGLPRNLEGAAKVLGLGGKHAAGRALMLKYCKPRRSMRKGESEWHDNPIELALIATYCEHDVELEREVHRRIPRLTVDEQNVWRLDQLINDRGVPIDVPWTGRVIAQLGEFAEVLNARLAVVTGGAVEVATQNARLLDWINRRGLNVGDVSAETVVDLLDWPELPTDVREALEIRQALGKSSIGKYPAMRDCVDVDDRIRGVHLYHGANTGRWSGQRVQLQNVPRGRIKPAEIDGTLKLLSGPRGLATWAELFGAASMSDTLSSLLRPTIQASRGKLLVACDFASIEARVLAWLSGNAKLLQAYCEGIDVYRLVASDIYQTPIDQITKDQRQIGKIAVLGLGYGMGADKFLATLGKYRIKGVDLDGAREIVEHFRARNPAIGCYWREVNAAAIKAMTQGATRVGHCQFRREASWLFCRLPSGRAIPYFSPTVEVEPTQWGDRPSLKYWSTDSVTKQWRSERTYGGKLVENIVQAVSRDLLAAALFRLERAGYPVAFHVHDEIVCEVEQDRADPREIERLMAVVPAWAEGCPVAAEGFAGRRYRK